MNGKKTHTHTTAGIHLCSYLYSMWYVVFTVSTGNKQQRGACAVTVIYYLIVEFWLKIIAATNCAGQAARSLLFISASKCKGPHTAQQER